MKFLKVLIVEDSDNDEALLLLYLARSGYEIYSQRAQTAEVMRAALAAQEWEIVISDFQMPNFTGLEAFEILKATGLDIPFILISGTIGEDTAVLAMLAGVNDYLMKDNLTRLAPAIERELAEAANRRGKREAEVALKKSEERFRTLAENNVAGVTLCKADGTLTYVNDAYLKIIGYSRGDFENNLINWREITAPQYIEADDEAIAQARQSGTSEPYEKEYICKDDKENCVLVALAASPSDGGEYFISTILDITECKQAEIERNESEENFRALIEATTQHVWTLSFEDESNGFRQKWMALTGQTEIEAKGLGWLNALHPEDREATRNAWEEAYENFTMYESVFRLRMKSGEYRFFVARGVPVFNQSGNFRQWIGTFTDITERKKVEQELRESESRQHLAISVANLGIWEWNIEMNKLFWSETNYEIFGRKIPVSGSDDFLNAVHPEDREKVWKLTQQSIETNTVYETEFRIIRPNGEIRWVNSRGIASYDQSGKPLQLLGVTLDFTDRKNAQGELLKSEEKLRQAQKLESVGRLAGGIAHDFNNMLTAINGYSDLTLRRMDETNPLRRNIEEIKKAGERSAELTHQLLAFSRRQILQPKILNINQIISETTVLLQRLIGEDVQLISALSSNIGQIEADPGQISQVIMNLVVNSRDAMPKGGTITIETEKVYLDEEFVKQISDLNPGHYILLAVSDTGTGIEKELLDNIFEPFFTTKEIGMGTGLGLATVYGIIKQSGGHINVQSTVNVGTTFEVYLPGIEDKPESEKKTAAPENLLMGTETIFIVEDEHMVRRLTRDVLESYGYKIIEAKNGEEALEILHKGDINFDLLMTDVVMPKMGGHELAENLVNIYPQIRILFTSGYTEDSKIQHEIAEIQTEFIHKPFTPDALALKIRQMLDVK